jgi:general secretion pathway protein K
MRTKGGALLAVLWLTAALSAIAFSVAGTVRGEIDRTSTAADGLRAYYLATGAVERALLYISWGPSQRLPDGAPRFWEPGMPVLRLPFPSGEAVVEVIPEAAKLNINLARPDDLLRLLIALGTEPAQAQEITAAIMDWRMPVPPGSMSPFDAHYLSLNPSFAARHASFEEIEEVLLVKGMTPDLFYGTYDRDAQGRWIPRGGLKDCISVFGATDQFDVNTAHPALLASLGLSPETVAAIVEMRSGMPFTSMQQLGPFLQTGGPGVQRLRVGGNSIYTLRATARLRLEDGKLSELRRSVAETVKLNPRGWDAPYHVLRWYDNPGLDLEGRR